MARLLLNFFCYILKIVSYIIMFAFVLRLGIKSMIKTTC